jgi:ABC-type multidrug transport system fused ATPase/permease subunit
LNSIKKIVAKYFKNFAFFYRYIGFRIFVSVILSILVGVLDGFGLAMFLPLLQMTDATSNVDPATLGNLKFIVVVLDKLGAGLNITTVLVVLILFFTFKGIAQFIRDSYRVSVQQLFIKKIRLNLVTGLNRMAYKSFVQADVGKIQNTLSGEVDKVARAYQSYFTAMQNLILVFVYVGFAFIADAKFAFLVSIGAVLTNLLYKRIYKNTRGASQKLTADSHAFQSLIIQFIHNFKYLKATALLNKYSRKLNESVLKIEDNNRRIGVLTAMLTASREPLLVMVVASVIFVQVKFVGVSLGVMMVSLLFFYRSLGALMQMQQFMGIFLGVSGSLNNMSDFTKELKSYQEPRGTKELQGFTDKIVLKNAGFHYGETRILKNIDLTISKNEVIAFVGESGSGKTTLVNVIAGLIPLDEGKLTIDGVAASELFLESYQHRIGYITQDPVIFNDTIFNNVTFWDEPSADNMVRFRSALQKAHIDKVIDGFPAQADTILGNNGLNLSGGQKQRISIARELYKNIDILVLDEATSALDSETEKTIQENIEELRGAYTILVVAHRLSTIKNADRIIFMKKGEIEMIDNFEGLIRQSSTFNRMVKLQEL